MVIRDFKGRQIKITHDPQANGPPWKAKFSSKHENDPQWIDEIAGYGDTPDEAHGYLILAFTNQARKP